MKKKPSTAERLLDEIEGYLLRTAVSATAFGVRAVNDRNLVHDMRRGRVINLDVYDRVKAFMRAHPPTYKIERGIPFPGKRQKPNLRII